MTAISATLGYPTMPPTGDTWEWPLPPHLRPGPALGRIGPTRRLLHWPRVLLGIDWLGLPEHPPPARFVIGRTHHEAWIADVVPDYESEQLAIHIAWEADRIDPLGCALVIRAERDGLPLLTRHLRVSDLPGHGVGDSDGQEARQKAWHERTLVINIPRGPRRTDWGVSLLSPDGRLLDERPVARRIEQISSSFYVGGATEPTSTSVVGDRRPPPSPDERDEAVDAARTLEAAAREAAAKRRISSGGELEDYLRWRFSARAGELLLLDPHLLDGDSSPVIAFLVSLDRAVRALARAVPEAARRQLESTAVSVRALPQGKAMLHDRVWLVGETGLLVGASINGFLKSDRPRRATTATELPVADATVWRQQFEGWWGG